MISYAPSEQLAIWRFQASIIAAWRIEETQMSGLDRRDDELEMPDGRPKPFQAMLDARHVSVFQPATISRSRSAVVR